MVNVKLGNTVYDGVSAIKVNTEDGGTALFSQAGTSYSLHTSVHNFMTTLAAPQNALLCTVERAR